MEALDTGLLRRKRVPVVLQSEASECGLACLAMCAGAYGREVSLHTLRSKHPASARGMTMAQLQHVSEQEGMEFLGYEADPADLESLRLPAVLHWDANHYVVMVAIKAGRRVTIHDPAIGVRTLTWNEFCQSYCGVAAEVVPTTDFKREKEAPRTSLWALLATVPNYRSLVAKLFVLALMLECAIMLTPLYLQNVIDQVLPSKDHKLLLTLGASFCGIVLIRVIASLSRSWTSMALSGYLTAGMKGAVFSHALRLPVEWFSKRGVGIVLSRFSSLNRVRDIAGTDVVLAGIDLILAVLMLAVMFVYAPLLATVSLVAGLGTLTLSALVQQPYSRSVNEAIAADAQESNVLIESISGSTAIKFFGTEAHQKRTYLASVLRSSNRLMDLKRLHILMRTGQSALTGLEEIVVVSLAGFMVMAGEITLGTMFGFYAYKQIFSVKLDGLAEVFFSLRELRLHAENVGDITYSETEAASEQELKVGVRTELQFENIEFTYDSSQDFLLRDFNLTVAAGEIVGITGPSGCGKSTLVRLLLGALKPTGGSIRLGGINITSKAPASYRPLMSVVMQDDSLFTGTVLQNITMFEEQPDEARALVALADAQLSDEIEAMPMGVHTTLMGINATLSGGQRQRLLLARAFYKNAPILVLDEATSALDVAKEIGVSEAIRRKGLTTLVIAHREETLKRCDRVVRLEGPK
jgi:ATP-binding cassette subfamily B protein RaxB